jgi:hypothetical protein
VFALHRSSSSVQRNSLRPIAVQRSSLRLAIVQRKARLFASAPACQISAQRVYFAAWQEKIMNTEEEKTTTGDQQAYQSETSQSGASHSEAPGSETDTDQSADSSAAQSEALIDELNRLGAKFAEAIEVAWKSEQRKRLEDDLRNGITSAAQSVEEHLKELSRREEARKVLDRAEDVADKVRSSRVSQEIASVLTQGLRALSEQLDKLAQEMREREAARTQTPPAETDVPVTEEPGGDQDIPIDRG